MKEENEIRGGLNTKESGIWKTLDKTAGGSDIGDVGNLCTLSDVLVGVCTFTGVALLPVFAKDFSEEELVDAVFAFSISILFGRVHKSSV